MASPAEVRVNGERLWASLMALAQIGATPKGGVCRLALSDLDRQARDWLCAQAQDLGLSVRVDAIGNVFLRRAGLRDDLPPIMTGSHIDTQPTGGKFDGNYGVLAGLEVVRALNDHGIQTQAPIEIVSWTNEEGSRFVPVMMGSGVYAGAIALDDAYAACDADGVSVREALTAIGYLGEQPAQATPVGAYFEAHIEQGPVLEQADVVIGVVPGVLGIRWFDCTVTGMEAHAGPTPMALRQDAMQGAAKLMQMVVALANDYAPHGRGTVGMVQVHPNSRNVIPGQVRFSVDLRASSDADVDVMAERFASQAQQAMADMGLRMSLVPVSSYPAQAFDAQCQAAIAQAAAQLGHSHMPVVSGAGHDAVYMARVAPTGMIFIPCKDGISHNEIEDARPEHITAGADVLLQVMLAAAGTA